MPISIDRQEELNKPENWKQRSTQVLRTQYNYGVKHACSACGAVHHYYDTVCHNKRCQHVGPLAVIKKEHKDAKSFD